jgi:hypothetical protein
MTRVDLRQTYAEAAVMPSRRTRMGAGPRIRCESSVMAKISQRLRELDRRVLREQKLNTAEGWLKTMSRWRLQLGTSIFLGAVEVFNIFVGNPLSSAMLVPLLLLTAFQAGAIRTEYERCLGKGTFMGRERPTCL